jgi:signal peptidase I
MKKQVKLDLKLNIEKEEYLSQNFDILYDRLTYNPLLKILYLSIILVISLLCNKRINKLSEITSIAIFNNANVITLSSFLITILIGIGISVLVCGFAIYIKTKKKDYDVDFIKTSYLIYNIYDMGIFILASVLTVLFCVMVVITPCNISGSSMNNTYQDKDKVLIWSLLYNVDNDDVIVFDSKNYVNSYNESKFYIKRAVGVEGDIVEYDPSTNYIYINKIYIETISMSDYKNITKNLKNDSAYSFTIPSDKVLVMGDNRINSTDSRVFGLIDEKDIIGKVFIRISPLSGLGNPDPDYNR